MSRTLKETTSSLRAECEGDVFLERAPATRLLLPSLLLPQWWMWFVETAHDLQTATSSLEGNAICLFHRSVSMSCVRVSRFWITCAWGEGAEGTGFLRKKRVVALRKSHRSNLMLHVEACSLEIGTKKWFKSNKNSLCQHKVSMDEAPLATVVTSAWTKPFHSGYLWVLLLCCYL